MKGELLLVRIILFFCSSSLRGQSQSSKVANSVGTSNECIRHPWQGKRVGYLGDPTTDPNCYGNKVKKYWDSLQERLGVTPYVYGISGRQWNSMSRQVEQLKKEHDEEVDAIVILMGTDGFNDGAPIEEWFTETEEQVVAARGQTQKLGIRRRRTSIMNGSTYRGCINIGISRLKQLFPDRQIVLLTPLHRPLVNFGETNVQPDESYQNSYGEYVDAYVQAVKETGNVQGTPAIDFNVVTGLNPIVEEQLIYFYDTGHDRLYPSAKGQIRMARTLMYQLLALPATF